MHHGKIILSTESISIIEFDDEIVMRFKKERLDHEHKYQARKSLEKIKRDRFGNPEIRKIKPRGKSPGSV